MSKPVVNIQYHFGDKLDAEEGASFPEGYHLEVSTGEETDFRDFVIYDGESCVSAFSSQGQDGTIAVSLTYVQVDGSIDNALFRDRAAIVSTQVEAQLNTWLLPPA
jgi:hypothetical protein